MHMHFIVAFHLIYLQGIWLKRVLTFNEDRYNPSYFLSLFFFGGGRGCLFMRVICCVKKFSLKGKQNKMQFLNSHSTSDMTCILGGEGSPHQPIPKLSQHQLGIIQFNSDCLELAQTPWVKGSVPQDRAYFRQQ